MEQRNLRNLREFFLVFLLFAHFFLTFAIVKYISNASTHSKYK